MKRNIIIMSAGIVLLYFVYIAVDFLIPLPIGTKSLEIEIPKGATFRQAVEILEREKLIRDRSVFLLIGRISGLHRKIRAGYYSVYGSMSPLDIFLMLKKGQIVEHEITVVEGDSLREISEKLAVKGIINDEDFSNLTVRKDFLEAYHIDAPSCEGYIFPETYRIPKGMNPEEAIGMMINKMRENYSAELRQRTAALGLSEREVLALASIIEKEAATDDERPLVSAVYHNRLRKKMRLQADPTSVYGIKASGERITGSDLKRKTPYNTYVITGLPPGPIASPGIKSIRAALYPADVQYIYFVSNNDGTHTFSVTSEQHLSAVASYREKKRLKAADKKESGNGKQKQENP
jgi:UPF0755 protein